MEIVRFRPDLKSIWDDYVDRSKNGTFMLKRDYMEYHADRFTDYSLLFYENGKLIALLPASIHESAIVSHGGLTYGGIVTDDSMTAQKMLCLMELLLIYLNAEHISDLYYKRIPSIYYKYPSDEDLYALFRCGASLTKCGISSTIYLPDRIEFSKRRVRNISKAIKTGLVFQESEDYHSYVPLLADVLKKRHGVTPVHTAEELIYLHNKFPENIRLFTVTTGNCLMAGVLVYETETVVHTQYLANSEEGRTCGALDYAIDKLINEVYPTKLYFDFGISTEDGGLVLNEGLICQKQEFGARGTVYQEYRIGL